MAIPENDVQELAALTQQIKTLIQSGAQTEAYEKICDAIGQYPHRAEPHNLLGILLEKQGRHPEAMKHFRAAYALDMTYLPSKYNLEAYGEMFGNKAPAYEESDCFQENDRRYGIK